jgi:hypothetical protein
MTDIIQLEIGEELILGFLGRNHHANLRCSFVPHSRALKDAHHYHTFTSKLGLKLNASILLPINQT